MAVVQWFVVPVAAGVDAGSRQWFALFGAPSSWHGLPKMAVAMFAHVGFSHLVYNLSLLGVSGYLLEEYLRPQTYVAFFVLGSVAAFIGETAVNQYVYGTTVLLLGASGGTWFLLGYASNAVRQHATGLLSLFLYVAPILMFCWAFASATILEREVANAGHITALAGGLVASYLHRRYR